MELEIELGLRLEASRETQKWKWLNISRYKTKYMECRFINTKKEDNEQLSLRANSTQKMLFLLPSIDCS